MSKETQPGYRLESGAIVTEGLTLKWPDEERIIKQTQASTRGACETLRNFHTINGTQYGLSEAIFNELNLPWGDMRSNITRKIIGRLLWQKGINPIKAGTSIKAYYKVSDIVECLREANEIIRAGADGIFLYKNGNVEEAKKMAKAERPEWKAKLDNAFREYKKKGASSL